MPLQDFENQTKVKYVTKGMVICIVIFELKYPQSVGTRG